MRHFEKGEKIGHLRGIKEPPEADDFVIHARRRERIDNGPLLCASATQNRRLYGLAWVVAQFVPASLDKPDYGSRFIFFCEKPRRDHAWRTPSGLGGAEFFCARAQWHPCHFARSKRRNHRVGGSQDACLVAPADGQVPKSHPRTTKAIDELS